jgi:RNA polymerase-binding transcription factor DksA
MDTAQYKESLLKELTLLEKELQSVGRINPENQNDWEPVANKLNIDTAEEEERASGITDFEDQSSVEFTLEERFNKVKAALARIENNTYGICRVCSATIEDARLRANPSAETCIAHRDN